MSCLIRTINLVLRIAAFNLQPSRTYLLKGPTGFLFCSVIRQNRTDEVTPIGLSFFFWHLKKKKKETIVTLRNIIVSIKGMVGYVCWRMGGKFLLGKLKTKRVLYEWNQLKALNTPLPHIKTVILYVYTKTTEFCFPPQGNGINLSVVQCMHSVRRPHPKCWIFQEGVLQPLPLLDPDQPLKSMFCLTWSIPVKQGCLNVSVYLIHTLATSIP